MQFFTIIWHVITNGNKTDGDKTDDDKTEGDKTDDKQTDITDMPGLESEQSTEQRRKQEGERLKILTPNQILSRLPIVLAQKKRQNNLEKLKKAIKQLLCSLCRSKKLTKTIYNNLINTI